MTDEQGGAGDALMDMMNVEMHATDQELGNQSTTGEKEEGYYEFTDSLGRKVLVPYNIKRVIPSGVFVQNMLCSLCPEKLVAVTATIEKGDVEAYRRAGMEHVPTLPETGELYSRHNRTINTSKIATIDADIFVDIGYHMDDLKSCLDYVQKKTEKPAVSIDGTFGNLPQAYRVFGKLLGCERRAEVLASYIERLYSSIEEKRKNVTTSPKILYVGNEMWLITKDHLRNKVIAYLGGTPVLSHGEPIDIDFIIKQNVDYIMFYNYGVFHSILNKQGEAYEMWSPVPAIQKNGYAVAPGLYHSWIGSPLFVQTILLPWLGNFFWPNAYNFDMVQLTREYYDLFFGYTMSADEAVTLLGW